MPHLLGLRGHRVGQNPEDQKMAPVAAVDAAGARVDAMSIGFLLDSEKEPVVLRGPRKDGVVRQFLGGVSWGELDVLLVDTPPGTSDEHMSLVGALSKTLGPHDGAVVVSTPQAVSLVDVRKELAFCGKQSLRVLGVVENMAPLRLPLHRLQFFDGAGDDVTEATLAALPASLRGVHAAVDVFPSAEGGAEAMAADFGVPFLGRVPLDGAITAASEAGAACASSIALDGVAATLLDALHLDDDAAGGAPPPSVAAERRRRRAARDAHAPAIAVDRGPAAEGGARRRRRQPCRRRRAPVGAEALPDDGARVPLRASAGAAARGLQRRPRRARRRRVRAVLARARGGGARADGAGGRLADDGEHALLPPAAGVLARGGRRRALGRPPARARVPLARRVDACRRRRLPRRARRRRRRRRRRGVAALLLGVGPPRRLDAPAARALGRVGDGDLLRARRPAGAAPLSLEDPRGRSPFDLVAGLEHRLRYGDGDGSGGAVPPFDRAVSVAAAPGVCVVFPPWIVHSVPPAPDDERRRGGVGARRRAAARLLLVQPAVGKWAHTAATR